MVNGAASGVATTAVAGGGATAGAAAAAALTGPALAASIGGIQVWSTLAQVACDVQYTKHLQRTRDAAAAEAAAEAAKKKEEEGGSKGKGGTSAAEENAARARGRAALRDVCRFGEHLAWAALREPDLEARSTARRAAAAGRAAFVAFLALAALAVVHVPSVLVARSSLKQRWREERQTELKLVKRLKNNPLAQQMHEEARDDQRRRRRVHRSNGGGGGGGAWGTLTRAARKTLSTAGRILLHSDSRFVIGGGRYSESDRLAMLTRGVHTTVHERPPSLLYKYANTSPRLAHYFLLLAFQPVCRSCAFTLFHEASTNAARVFALVVFVVGCLGFIVHVARLVYVKVGRERRAALIQDQHRTGGVLAWMGPSTFCRTLFQIECAVWHSYGPESHSR